MKNIKFTEKDSFLLIFLFTVSLYLLGSCEIQKDFKYIPSEENITKSMTTLELIEQNESFTLMREAIQITGLSDIFANQNDLTYILPSDVAFKDYLDKNNYLKLSDVPVPILRNILLYHVVNDRVSFDDPSLSQHNNILEYETKNGQSMYLSHNNNYQGIINDGTSKSWTILISNIPTKNGVIHVLNNLVYFSAKTDNVSQPDISFTTDTIYAIHDAYINGGASSSVNYGKDPLIKVKNVDGNGDYDRKTYLMFDLADFSTEGNLRDAIVEVDVSFTHGKGIKLSLFEAADNNWNENTINWNNAPPKGNEIASLISSKVTVFKWNVTDYIKGKITNPDKLSIIIDAEPGSDETDDLISKEHANNKPPRIITVFSSGESNLTFGKSEGLTVNRGEIAIINNSALEMTGSKDSDIIYKIEEAPLHGWLIKGADILKKDDVFTQQEVNANNIIYINDGSSSETDFITLSVSDPDGGEIEPFNFQVTIK